MAKAQGKAAIIPLNKASNVQIEQAFGSVGGWDNHPNATAGLIRRLYKKWGVVAVKDHYGNGQLISAVFADDVKPKKPTPKVPTAIDEALKRKVTKVIKAHVCVYTDRPTVKLDQPLHFQASSVELWNLLADIESDLGIVGTAASRKAIRLGVRSVGDLVWALMHYVQQSEKAKANKKPAPKAKTKTARKPNTTAWALAQLERFEYSSDWDGHIKRYPDLADYERAMKIIKAALAKKG